MEQKNQQVPLRQRQMELRAQMRRPGGISILEERELLSIEARLRDAREPITMRSHGAPAPAA